MSSSKNEGNKVTLRSWDGEEFEVKEEVAMQSMTFKLLIQDGCADGGIPVPNVNGKILSKILEFCKKHAEEATDEKELKSWDDEYMKVDLNTHYDLLVAANYLNIKELLDLTSQKVADMVKGKTPEEIREVFSIKNDFTPEEEEEIRNENKWAFE